MMKQNRPLMNLSFRAKVLVPVITVMVVLLATTVFVVSVRFQNQMLDNAKSELAAAKQSFGNGQLKHQHYLQLRFRSLANEPMYRAAFQTLDAKTIRKSIAAMVETEDLADENVDFVFFTMTDPKPSDNSVAMIEQRDPLISSKAIMAGSDPVVNQTLQGEPMSDTVRVGEKLYNVVSIPIFNGDRDRVIGALTFGEDIGLKMAQEFSAGVGTHRLTALIAGDHVIASTLPANQLTAHLADRFKELAGATDSALAIKKSIIGDEHYFYTSGKFASLKHDPTIGYLLFSSYEDQLTALAETQKLLLTLSLAAILVGSAIVWFFVRRVTEPLRELRDSAEAVGRGDFSRRVPVRSRDECGELANVFNQMTENLQQSRSQLEKTVETLKNTQSQLIQSEKLSAVGEFVAGVAHELNNPLAAVMGFSEMLKDADVDSKYRRYLDMIYKSSKRCQKIVQSLLSFARKHQSERKPVSVNKIVEAVLEIVSYPLRTSNIELVLQLDPHPPFVLADEHQIQQVILNTINNARQAIEAHQPNGRIKIVTESSATSVRIVIQDNGPGIAKENLPRIFDPFFTTKQVGQGTGLGLSLCYGIIKEHGGNITPSSQPGEGATFIIELPVFHIAGDTTEILHLAEMKTLDANEGAGKKVLIIDDEETLLQMIREELVRHGYEVGLAADGEAGLRQLRENHFDLTFCDWKMPGLNGRQFYERLRRDQPDHCQRVVFITGDVINEPMRQFLEIEKRQCLAKPFTLVELRNSIKTALAAA
jgi:two-component system NtrC family sensor kinase